MLWPESATPFMFEEDAGRRRPGPRARARGARADSGRQRPDRMAATDRGRVPDKFYNSAFLVRADGIDRRRLPQDAPRAVRRVRAAPEAAVLCGAAGRSSVGLLRRRCDPALLPVERPPGQLGDLLRDRLSGSGAAVRRRRQRAADDDHQRRLVRPRRRRRTSTSRRRRCARSRTGAIWSAPPTPASAASSIRTAASSRGADIFEPAVIVGDARFLRRPRRSTRASATSSRTRRRWSRAAGAAG